MRALFRLVARYGVAYAGATVVAVLVAGTVLPVGRSLLLFGVGFVALGAGGLLLRGPMTADPGEGLDELRAGPGESAGPTGAGPVDRRYAVAIAYTLGVFLLSWVALLVPLFA